jgi:hypothetical protein
MPTRTSVDARLVITDRASSERIDAKLEKFRHEPA